MKRKFISFIAAITMFAFIPSTAFSTGYPVFDASNWLGTIDQLFQMYDMVQNTITQIENQYKSIQQAVERAKAIDWDNRMAKYRADIDWEGMFSEAIDEEKARRYRKESTPENEDTCTMCGKMCSMRTMKKVMSGEDVNILK